MEGEDKISVFLQQNTHQQFFDSNGVPLVGGKVFFYASGSTTKQNTYTDSTGTIPNADPMITDAAGRLAQAVWMTGGLTYKVGVTLSTEPDPPSNFITPWPLDNIKGIGDTTTTVTEWLASGLTPTYVSATSFTLVGDQTNAFTPGRALQIIDSGGTKYAWIKTSAYGALTTITLDQNSAALASPLSSVAYGILQSTNSSTPILSDSFPIVGGSSDRSKQLRFEIDGFTTATTRVLTLPDANLTLPNASVQGRIPIATSVGVLGMAPALNKVIYGLTYANNAVDVVNDLDIASGGGMDDTGAYWITTAAFTKQSDVAWAVGSTAGGLDTGAVGNSDYYIWAIARSDTGVTDILYSLSSTAPTMPTNYNFKRLIGWFKRLVGTIVAFTTYETEGGGLQLLWSSPTLDVNLANTLTTARRTDALKVPLNFSVIAEINLTLVDIASSFVYMACPDTADLAPSTTVAPLSTGRAETASSTYQTKHFIRTSSTGTIAARANLATVDSYQIVTIGFTWARRN